MAIRNIVKKGDEVLTKRCRPVEKFDAKLAALLDDMLQTMYKAEGVGLAAPQVGLLRRIAVIDITEEHNDPIELINPEIIKSSGRQREIEGCLSCPDQWGYVKRPMKVVCRAQDRKGDWYEYKAEGFLARAICHELDHLDGQLFVDKVDEFVRPEDME
ncbi:MAG: peptide deformylase [Oscillospiraceae bacterium]|nr:peptide deformylase [Oscillospiraceae bacterium]